MKQYSFMIESAVKVIRANSLEEAQEELDEFVDMEFDGAIYSTKPIDVED